VFPRTTSKFALTYKGVGPRMTPREEHHPSFSRTWSECALTYKGVGLRAFAPGRGRPALLRILSEWRVTDKAVEPSPLRHAFSWERAPMGTV